MRPKISPLEHLAAFSIVFVAGALSAAGFVAHVGRVRRNAVRDHYEMLKTQSNLPGTSPNKGSGQE